MLAGRDAIVKQIVPLQRREGVGSLSPAVALNLRYSDLVCRENEKPDRFPILLAVVKDRLRRAAE